MQSPSSMQSIAESLDPAIYQQAAYYQLGTPIATYRPTFTNPFVILGITIATLVVDIALLLIVLSSGWIVALFIAIPIAIIIFCIRALLSINLRLYLFQNGFISARGQRIDIVRWDQVRAIWQRITKSYGMVSHYYKIERNDGTSIKLDSMIKNIGQLGQTIQQQVTQRHLPQAIAAYNAGALLTFGPLSVSSQGLSKGNDVVPWGQLQPMLISQGYLLVRKQGSKRNWARVSLSSIPNYLVFIQLTTYARTGVQPH